MRRIIAHGLGRERHLLAKEGQGIGLEEAAHPLGGGRPVAQHRAQQRKARQALDHRGLLDPAPELPQLGNSVLRPVAGDQARIDRPDRGADHPVGLDARLMHRLVDAGLIGAERAPALEDEDDLADAPIETARGALSLHGASLGRLTAALLIRILLIPILLIPILGFHLGFPSGVGAISERRSKRSSRSPSRSWRIAPRAR